MKKVITIIFSIIGIGCSLMSFFDEKPKEKPEPTSCKDNFMVCYTEDGKQGICFNKQCIVPDESCGNGKLKGNICKIDIFTQTIYKCNAKGRCEEAVKECRNNKGKLCFDPENPFSLTYCRNEVCIPGELADCRNMQPETICDTDDDLRNTPEVCLDNECVVESCNNLTQDRSCIYRGENTIAKGVCIGDKCIPTKFFEYNINIEWNNIDRPKEDAKLKLGVDSEGIIILGEPYYNEQKGRLIFLNITKGNQKEIFMEASEFIDDTDNKNIGKAIETVNIKGKDYFLVLSNKKLYIFKGTEKKQEFDITGLCNNCNEFKDSIAGIYDTIVEKLYVAVQVSSTELHLEEISDVVNFNNLAYIGNINLEDVIITELNKVILSFVNTYPVRLLVGYCVEKNQNNNCVKSHLYIFEAGYIDNHINEFVSYLTDFIEFEGGIFSITPLNNLNIRGEDFSIAIGLISEDASKIEVWGFSKNDNIECEGDLLELGQAIACKFQESSPSEWGLIWDNDIGFGRSIAFCEIGDEIVVSGDRANIKGNDKAGEIFLFHPDSENINIWANIPLPIRTSCLDKCFPSYQFEELGKKVICKDIVSESPETEIIAINGLHQNEVTIRIFGRIPH